MIVKQSEELETHAEHLYESVLAAAGKNRVEDKEGTAESCSVGKHGGKLTFLHQGEREGREDKLASTAHLHLLLFHFI